MFATPPQANMYGHHQSSAFLPQPPAEQWMQTFPFTAEPEHDPALLAGVPVPFLPPHTVPSQQYPQQHGYPPSAPSSAAHSAPSPSSHVSNPSGSSSPPIARPQQQPKPAKQPTQARQHQQQQPAPKKLAPILPSPPASHTGPAAAAKKAPKGVKRAKNNPDADVHEHDSDTGSGDYTSDDADAEAGAGPQASAGGNAARRPPGACTYCRRVKMKCEFPAGADVCKRCRVGNHKCVVEGRKPRRAPSKREYLLAQLRQKDGIIESLLKQLHNPYANQALASAPFEDATAETDAHRASVVAWLDQLQSTVKHPAKRGAAADHQPLVPATSPRISRDDSDSDRDMLGSEEDAHPALPDAAAPLGLLAAFARSGMRAEHQAPATKRIRGADDEPEGIADPEYFVPGPSLDLGRRISLNDTNTAPDLIVHGVVQPQDVDNLFNIFHTRVNPFMGVLDPVLHTPTNTFARSPLLFTTVCALALRHTGAGGGAADKAALAMHFAKRGAADALVDGLKSPELAQAYVFLSMYAPPARRLEEDRSMLYAGLAVRIATDLNLHDTAATSRAPRDVAEARERANHRRLWMACFTLDKQTAAAFGKPSTVRGDFGGPSSFASPASASSASASVQPATHGPAVSSGVDGFPEAVSDDNPFDIHLAAKSMLMRDLTRFHAEVFSDPHAPGALNSDLDLREIVLRYDAEFTRTSDEWTGRFQRESDKNNAAAAFRCKLLPFYVGASRLVILSFMLQQAFKRGLAQSDDLFFKRSMEVARGVVNILLDLIAPTGYLRYAPDCYFVYSTFAAAFMLKLLRPDCKPFVRDGKEREALQAVERLIDTFNSPKVAIDARHTPHLYARFLAQLLERHTREARERAHAHARGVSPAVSSASSSVSAGSAQSYAARQRLLLQQQQQQQHGQQYLSPPMTYVPSMNPVDMINPGAAGFGSTWEPCASGYPTPESLPEPLYETASVSASAVDGAQFEQMGAGAYEGAQQGGVYADGAYDQATDGAFPMGKNPAYAFTFTTAPPAEEVRCHEEMASAWWGGIVDPALGWMSDGIAMAPAGEYPQQLGGGCAPQQQQQQQQQQWPSPYAEGSAQEVYVPAGGY